jgi:hypothetical protein
VAPTREPDRDLSGGTRHPTSPSGEQTLRRALGALTIPAVGFLLAVLAEVYAEHLLDQVML